MAKFLSDYICNRELPSYPVLSDDWFVPNIWVENQDIEGKYHGWLHKPQYRICQVNLSAFPFAVFDESEDRDFIGFYSNLEEAHQAGQKSVGCTWLNLLISALLV